MVKEIKNVVDYLRSISPVWDELQRGRAKACYIVKSNGSFYES